MIVVIQCAARKREDAGVLRTREGKPVFFVGDPFAAPASENCIYARPDDMSDQGATWREVLVRYNEKPGGNALGLYPASELYKNEVYRELAQKFGVENTYILSAGWGLIPSSFLTPFYDITFSASAEEWKRRKKRDAYADLSKIPNDRDEQILFVGGKDYLPLFLRITATARSPRTILYNSAIMPHAPGCNLIRFPTTTRTNWHYECASALIRGDFIFE